MPDWEKRERNRNRGPAILKSAGVEFEEKNGGSHIVATYREVTYDYWPGTGKFIERHGQREGRGVFNLLRILGVPNGDIRKARKEGIRA